ncbi:hypothetical protein L345_01375, partial [Ophiophagus hannah]
MTDTVAQHFLAESEEAELRLHVDRLPDGVLWVAYAVVKKSQSLGINIVNDEKVHKIDKVFTEIQKNVKQLSKTVPSGSSKKLQIPMSQEDKPANVDAAANLLSQL